MDLCEIRETVKRMIKDQRYQHTLGVEEVASDLAVIYGCNEQKARIAAILHDCAKNLSVEQLLIECEKNQIILTEHDRISTSLLHSKVGAVYAESMFGIEDKEILNAIFYHTTGRPGMTLLERIIFVSDFIEPNRISLPHMAEIRWAAYTDLNQAIVMTAKSTLEYLEREGKNYDPLTKETYEYYQALQNDR